MPTSAGGPDALQSLKDKAKKQPNARHEKEIHDRDRKIHQLEDELKRLKVRSRIAEKELEEAEARIEFCEHFKKPPRIKPIAGLPKTKSRGPATCIISLCDWHCEEKVTSESTNFLNKYDLSIAEQRIRKTFENAVQLLDVEQRLSRIQDIVLALLGDFINGYIHDEFVEDNYLSPTEACLFVQENIVWGIEYLLKNTPFSIRIPTANGNHGRTTEKRRCATAYRNSFEWLLYQQISRFYTSHPRVHWNVSPSYHCYEQIQGKTVRFHHGDSIRYAGGVGGITIPVQKSIAAWDRNKYADLDIFGHYHQKFFHRKFIACNCLVGFNAFAIEIKAEFSEPSQTMVIIDKNRPSWVSAREIFCD